MRLRRVTTVSLLKRCDDFLAEHGPVGGKPASVCDSVWVLEHRGSIVGVACSNWRKWKHYHLANAAVHPTHRGKRLQLRLIDARLAHARALGREARTYTHEGNIPSMLNLIRAGMRPFSRDDQWVRFTSASGDPALESA